MIPIGPLPQKHVQAGAIRLIRITPFAPQRTYVLTWLPHIDKFSKGRCEMRNVLGFLTIYSRYFGAAATI